MFVDASAIVAVMSEEAESGRISEAIALAERPVTSAVAVLEAALALARPDKFGMPITVLEMAILEFLEARGISLHDLPPAAATASLALSAAHRFRSGRHGLNLGDCLHYACARYERIPILATADEFKQTDLDVVR